MNWPTSLESNVTGTLEKRSKEIDASEGTGSTIDIAARIREDLLPLSDIGERAPSSSNDTGNTTNPPSVFGLIPLGNSFSIPITYSPNSRFASTLPEGYISDTPTTYTNHGATYLNWTIQLAKGTRFILVAGIGSAQQWASGGSSRLLTVGQGDTSCQAPQTGPDAAPSVTATGT
jgi:hypothetical protein